jgi:hypothetical protein
MADEFIEIRCRRIIPEKGPSFECRQLVGGPSRESIAALKEPFTDVRFCPECHGGIKTTFFPDGRIPLTEMLPAGSRINFVRPEAVFTFVEVVR